MARDWSHAGQSVCWWPRNQEGAVLDSLSGSSPCTSRTYNRQQGLERAGAQQGWAWIVQTERDNLSTAAAVGVNNRYSAWRDPSMWLPHW